MKKPKTASSKAKKPATAKQLAHRAKFAAAAKAAKTGRKPNETFAQALKRYL